MNLFEVANIIGGFVKKRVQPEEFDSLANFAQVILFRQRIDEGDDVSLRPFKKTMGIDNATPPLYVNSSGYAILPSDYYKYTSLTYICDGTERLVEVLDDTDFDDRKTHHIEVPTKEFPVASFRGGTARFMPKNLQYVHMSYFIQPPMVHYAIDKSSGWARYDSVNSTEFLWDNDNVVKIIMIMLQSLGVVASEKQVAEKHGQLNG